MRQWAASAIKPRKSWAVMMALGLLLAGGFYLFAGSGQIFVQANVATSAPAPLQVEVAPLQIQDSFTVVRRFSGEIAPNAAVELAFEESGRLVDLSAEEGDDVAEGDVVASLDTRLLKSEHNWLNQLLTHALTEHALLERSLEREASLQAQNLRSVGSLDQASIALTQNKSRLADLRRQIEQIEIRLERSVLRAPFSGRISQVYDDIGDTIARGSPVFRLIADGPLEARIGIDAPLIDRFAVGAKSTLWLENQPVEARVLRILPELDPVTQTRTVVFSVPRDAPGAIAGGIASLNVEERVEVEGARIPMTALRDGLRGLWEILIAVPTEDGHEIGVDAVEVLHVNQDSVFIRGTFSPGALVVLEGQHRLVQGQGVRVTR